MLFYHYSDTTALIKLTYHVKIVSVPRKVSGDVQVFAWVSFWTAHAFGLSCCDNLCCCEFHMLLCRNGHFNSPAFACLWCWNVSKNDFTSLPRAQLSTRVRWRGAWWISTQTEGCDAPLALLFMSYFVKIHSNFNLSNYRLNCCWTKQRQRKGKWRVEQCFT